MSSQQGNRISAEGTVLITIVNVLSAGGTGYCTPHNNRYPLSGRYRAYHKSPLSTVRITEVGNCPLNSRYRTHRKQFISSLQAVQYTSQTMHTLATGGTVHITRVNALSTIGAGDITRIGTVHITRVNVLSAGDPVHITRLIFSAVGIAHIARVDVHSAGGTVHITKSSH